MATSKERVAKMRARRKKGRLLIWTEVDEADLREIVLAGYPDAASSWVMPSTDKGLYRPVRQVMLLTR